MDPPAEQLKFVIFFHVDHTAKNRRSLRFEKKLEYELGRLRNPGFLERGPSGRCPLCFLFDSRPIWFPSHLAFFVSAGRGDATFGRGREQIGRRVSSGLRCFLPGRVYLRSWLRSFCGQKHFATRFRCNVPSAGGPPQGGTLAGAPRSGPGGWCRLTPSPATEPAPPSGNPFDCAHP